MQKCMPDDKPGLAKLGLLRLDGELVVAQHLADRPQAACLGHYLSVHADLQSEGVAAGDPEALHRLVDREAGTALQQHLFPELSLGLAAFVGVSRPGYELTDAHITEAFDRLPDDALHLVEIPALAISSTDCRQRAAQGRPIWYLVPDGVVQYVAKRGLYRSLATTMEVR